MSLRFVITGIIAAAWCAACGGSAAAPADPTPGDPEPTAGSEVSDATEASDCAADDPACAPSDESASASAEGETGEDETATPEEGEAETAEAAEGEAEDPAAVWRAMVGRGRSVFNRACDTCHPGGEDDIGPSILGKRLPVATMRRQIRRGTGKMKPIPPAKLPERYMNDLMAYLSTLRAVRGVERPQ